MIIKEFPFNPLIISMGYNPANQELRIDYRSTGESRTYAEVPKEIFYGIYYKYKVGELLSFYSKNIRKKFKVLTIKPL